MERVGANDHPLSSFSASTAGGGRSSLLSNTANSRTPSASLIQSAVRSVLDDASPSTIVSDDRSDDSEEGAESFVDGNRVTPNKYYPGKNKNNDSSTPTLESLQMQQIPPIPDEQDRKRFIGCLAAVLASAYDYDELDEKTVSDATDATFAYLDHTDDDEDDDDVENDDGDRSFSYNSRTSLSSSFEEHETATSVDFDDSSSVRRKRKEESSPSKLKRSSSNTNTGTSSMGPNWGRVAREKEARARQRNRRRRYDVCCELLVSSSELLLLPKGVARGFLPMLSRILVPPRMQNKKATENRSGLPPTGRNAKSRSAPSSPDDRGKQSTLPTSTSFSIDARYNTVELQTETGPPTEKEQAKDYQTEEFDRDDVLQAFLESMTPGSGFRCISLMLLQHLLTSKVGYDARIRHVLKKLGVVVLVHDMTNDPVEQELLHGSVQGNSKSYEEWVTHATRKFEALEASIARRLIRLSKTAQDKKIRDDSIVSKSKVKDNGFTKENILRGVKIGSAGIVAGTLFALTGGLAAPGIAAGVAAVAGSTAAATVVVGALTSTAVVTTIFGVGGGSLAAYKMQRRTQGLTEFEFRKEFANRANPADSASSYHTVGKSEVEAELFTTICISGWLRDKYDYQRPWGLHPTKPRLTDHLELLERFYSVMRPDYLPNCTKILTSWKGEERKLWAVLEEKYGRDPDHLFPLVDGPRLKGNLTLDQEEALDAMFVELGYNSVAPTKDGAHHKTQRTPFERMRDGWKEHQRQKIHTNHGPARNYDSMHGPFSDSYGSLHGNGNGTSNDRLQRKQSNEGSEEAEYEPPKHLETVWDYRTTYGGELYTVRWESTLLKTICDCVMDLAMDVVSGATKQILKATVLSTLLAAVVLPSYLLNVANMIDGDWTLAVERADEAGKELARTLLFSRAGQRPVTLVGFSFGARVIYACLKELAKLQDEWEDFEELKRTEKRTASQQHQFSKLSHKFSGMREPSSVVEDAIIMGLPNHLSLPSWKACRQVVAGRLVNCFSTKDLILSLMFQAKRFSPGVQTILKPVCGTCEVNEPGVENIDVSDLVQGHQDYCLLTGKILERVKFGEPLRRIRCGQKDEDLPAKQLQY